MKAAPGVTNADIREHMAVMRQTHNNTGPRVECSYCEFTMAPGHEPATPGICSECAPTFRRGVGEGDVTYLYTLSELEWGRYMRSDLSQPHVEVTAAAHVAWRRANARARTALRLYVEDLKRRAQDARDARDHLIREWRAER